MAVDLRPVGEAVALGLAALSFLPILSGSVARGSAGALTIKTHVSRLFLKLDLRERAQLVVLAYETGVVRPGDTAA